jgi:plasmid stability protein
MKTTLDIPDELLARLRERAARDGRDIDQLAASLLADALVSPAQNGAALVPKTLPLIKARPAELSVKPVTGQEFSDFIKELEQQHEVERYERAFGHQHVDRAQP